MGVNNYKQKKSLLDNLLLQLQIHLLNKKMYAKCHMRSKMIILLISTGMFLFAFCLAS